MPSGAGFSCSGREDDVTEAHRPVMADEVVELLAPAAGDRHLDCTLGAGGHFLRVATAWKPRQMLGVDRDIGVLAATARRLAPQLRGACFLHAPFSSLPRLLPRLLPGPVQTMLVDLGVSSIQLDRPERGFSFQQDGPLDMRMDRSRGRPLGEWLKSLDEQELARILWEYGEERHSRRIARRIHAQLQTGAIVGTGQLRSLIHAAIGSPRSGRIDSATRSFQALRIALNGELDELQRLLDALPDLLAPGGRCAILSFHSLEDRLVKRFIRREAADCLCPDRRLPCRCGQIPRLRDLTRRPRRPGDAECQYNPRARSACLRVCERLP